MAALFGVIKIMLTRLILLGVVMLALMGAVSAQEPKPFIWPAAGESSPSTWILGQLYGNTTGAFVSGANSYSAGQFLHFGIDISMACGTPVLAVADGVVDSVDNPSRGSAPHNLLLRFPDLGVAVLYGHLLERSTLIAGQPVQQGDVVGLSGDPDLTCDSRPHLHLEVRSLDHTIAYNPVLYIQAPWHSLAGIDSRLRPIFQRDLMNPRQWMHLEDQPNVQFGGQRLNNYAETYPNPLDRQAIYSLPERPFTPINRNWTLRQVGLGGCCAWAWWHPQDTNRIYFIDGIAGQLAYIFEATLDNSQPPITPQNAPPPILSGDGTFEIMYEPQRTVIRRLADGHEWYLPLSDVRPSLSPDNQTLMWSQGATLREIWVSPMDGAASRVVWQSTRNATARWLDGQRLLISERESDTGRYSTLTVVNLGDDSSYPLGTWHNIRNLQIAPGGGRLIFFSTFNPDPVQNGVFALETLPDSLPTQLPWFGDYRWRDSESLFYITFDPATDIQRLNYYHVPSGETFPLTDPALLPFIIGNGDWTVAPDGNSIIFQEARDGNLWLLASD